mgnify:CR=1 FL=1
MSAKDWHFNDEGELVPVTRAGETLGETPREVTGDPVTEDDIAAAVRLLGTENE